MLWPSTARIDRTEASRISEQDVHEIKDGWLAFASEELGGGGTATLL